MFTLFAATALFAIAQPAPWRELGRSHGVFVYEREREGSEIHELFVVSVIDGPPLTVWRALTSDAEAEKEPYLVERKVLKSDAGGDVIYHLTAPPIITARDFTIRTRKEVQRQDDGSTVYLTHWAIANEEGPPPRAGVVRVEHNEGWCKLEPVGNGTQTRLSYQVFASLGGAVPPDLEAWGARIIVRDIVAKLRARVKRHIAAAPTAAAPTADR